MEVGKNNGATNWNKLNLQLPITGCDIGCLPIKKDQILIFGGWNKNAQTGAFFINHNGDKKDLMESADSHLSLEVSQTKPLGSPDFFLVNGIAMKS